MTLAHVWAPFSIEKTSSLMDWLVHPFLLSFSLTLDLSILRWAFGKPSTVVSIWLVMKVMAMSAFPIFMAWHSNRHSWMPLPDVAWFMLYITYLIVFAIFPVQEVCQHNLPPASSIIILAEQVINWQSKFFLRSRGLWDRYGLVCPLSPRGGRGGCEVWS